MNTIIIKYQVRDVTTGYVSPYFRIFHTAWVLAGKIDDMHGQLSTEIIRDVDGKTAKIPRPLH